MENEAGTRENQASKTKHHKKEEKKKPEEWNWDYHTANKKCNVKNIVHFAKTQWLFSKIACWCITIGNSG